ncbi:MAG: UDP-N-acetylmuramoyl-tripeptide--D-alanyl-D-alanine ligase [Gallionellaceae bacterium]|nr:MAG: UDP-N-acetylmuramoyl-tripeptide--D-alanyl-D-alanine ligase [Gallionellaceae bacterium]
MLLSQAAQVLGGRQVGTDVKFAAVSSDSRTVAAGDLFVALRGENFDGAEFVAGAAQAGAVAALVHTGASIAATPPCPLLLVEDTRLALGRLAAYWRAQFAVPVVAVTGSNGKTTVKEMLASILREAAEGVDAVLATTGNLNNDIGMPLTLLKLRGNHRYAVIEMGMNHPGEIAYLSRLARPDVAVINNAASAHLAGLGSVEAVARAKGEILEGLPDHGIAVINADDFYAPLWREQAGGRTTIGFGLKQDAAVRAQWRPHGSGAEVEVNTPQGNFTVLLQVPGAHNARNALAAVAAALALRVGLPAIAAGLEKFAGVAGRLQRKAALRGATLIDDSYNANPASVHAALEVLAQAEGRKILVLGDMGELGSSALRLHQEIGAEARRLGVDSLWALGELTLRAAREFGAGARHFERIEDLLAALDHDLGTGDTVLVKGSRFMRMERVVAHCVGEEKREGGRGKSGAAGGYYPSPLPLPPSQDCKEQKCC